jgi:hypothetical protein
MVANWDQLSPEKKIEILKQELELANRRIEGLTNGMSEIYRRHDAAVKELTERLEKLEG